jgi:uncharacterized membrane protein
MPKENTPDARKSSASLNGAKSSEKATKKTDVENRQDDLMVTPAPPTTPKHSTNSGRSKQSGRGSVSRVGGTAVPGAKSTRPKEITTSNPQQQQVESYNRTMRRRMDQMGTTPNTQSTALDQRRKRLEKRKQRSEERRQEVKKVAATGPRKITIGSKNTYFLIGVALLIIIIIVLATLFNNHIL